MLYPCIWEHKEGTGPATVAHERHEHWQRGKFMITWIRFTATEI